MNSEFSYAVWAQRITLLALIVLSFLLPEIALAQDGAEEFTTIWERLLGWTTGILGKILALVMFVVGMGFGIARQSVMPIVMGIAAAFALAYVPGVIDSIFTAAPAGP